jgi:peptidoglycan/LPS O-acetylase OafA/YrhL
MKQRLSNFEALRLLAMLFVLIVHAGFLSLGVPQVADGEILLTMFLIAVFIISILLDRARIFLWNRVDKMIGHAE